MLRQDSALIHESTIAMATILECGFQQLQHSPNLTDLTLSDYYHFSFLKKNLAAKNCNTDNEEIKASK